MALPVHHLDHANKKPDVILTSFFDGRAQTLVQGMKRPSKAAKFQCQSCAVNVVQGIGTFTLEIVGSSGIAPLVVPNETRHNKCYDTCRIYIWPSNYPFGPIYSPSEYSLLDINFVHNIGCHSRIIF
jgi:hypothetical protein